MGVGSLSSIAETTARTLVWVQQGVAGPPIYCFHPLGGSAAVYGQLAIHIGRHQPVRGLQAIGLQPGCDPDRTVADMARRYAAEIRQDRPPARPVFVGYSMGGVLAVETARRLSAELPEPPAVVAIDCDPLYSTGDDAGPWRVLAHQVLAIDLPVQRLAQSSIPDGLALVRAAAAEQGRIPLRFPLDRLHAMLRVCQANERAAAAHVPSHYPGTVHVLRPATSGAVAGGDMWNGFADHVALSLVAADHHTIMGTPGYPLVAARIRELIGDGSRMVEPPER